MSKFPQSPRVLFAFCLTAVTLLLPGRNAHAEQPLNLLFFGNSFTMYNDLPSLVRKIAVADGHVTPLVVSDLAGGTYLSYHIGEVNTNPVNNVNNAAIAGKTWDYVVIQGYSTEATQIGNPTAFRANAQTLYTTVRDHLSGRGAGSKAVLYETWARPNLVPGTFPTLTSMQAQITTQYRQAADEINTAQGNDSARVATVGEAFESRGFSSSLYASDNYHPSMSGSLLAAMVIYRTIYDENVADMPFASVQSWAGVSQTTWDSLTLSADASPIVTPEPTTLALLALGGLALIRRKR